MKENCAVLFWLGPAQFGQGQEIGALKLWLVEEACFDPTGLVSQGAE
jgi:hypothetical protein